MRTIAGKVCWRLARRIDSTVTPPSTAYNLNSLGLPLNKVACVEKSQVMWYQTVTGEDNVYSSVLFTERTLCQLGILNKLLAILTVKESYNITIIHCYINAFLIS